MRLERLALENFRSYEALDLDLGNVTCAAIIGRNGAGKSTIPVAVEYALFGGKADDLMRWGAERSGVTLELTVDDVRWQINRTRDRGKKSLLVIKRDGQVQDTHTVVAAQEMIETLLGFDQDAYRATVYAPQGQTGRLASLSPGERKALLASLVGLERYEEWREQASAQARELAGVVLYRRGAISANEARERSAQEALVDPDEAVKRVAALTAEVGRLEAEIQAAHERAKLAEQVRLRARLVAQMGEIKATAQAQREVAEQREKLQAYIRAGKGAPERLAAAETAQRHHAEKVSAARVEQGTRTGAAQQRRREADELYRNLHRISEREGEQRKLSLRAQREIEALEQPGATCASCGQTVDGAHREQALEGARKRMEEAGDALARLAAERNENEELRAVARKEADELEAAAAAVTMPEPFDETELLACREDVERLRTAEARLHALPKPRDTAELRSEWAKLREEAATLPAEVPAGRAVPEITAELTATRANLTQAERKIEQHGDAVREIARLREEVAKLTEEGERDEERSAALAACERAFSRNGIPSLVLDNVVGGIEVAANDVLERLGAEMRLRLVTQRAKKSGTGMTETLEILVDDGQAERALPTFSGGEAYRVHIALRLGLAQVLTSGTGVDVGFLLLDEPDSLDGEGLATLAELLPRTGRQVLLVSHAAQLVDAMPQKIVVERTEGAASELVVA